MPAESTVPFALLSFADLDAPADGPVQWVWDGYVAAGAVTLFTSRWKTGKTTLLSVLLARMAAGGTLAGATVSPGRAVTVSEESIAVWAGRRRWLDLGPHLAWLCRPFKGRPTAVQWQNLIDQLAEQPNLALAVIDPVAMFLPWADENNATTVTRALAPLHDLTARGVAVLLLHHPRKGAKGEAIDPRGSGALQGFADMLVELDRVRGAPLEDRRRRLRVRSRFAAPPERLIELNEGGTDYAVLDEVADEFRVGWEQVHAVLAGAPAPLNRRDILESWPLDFDRPARGTVWRWLDRALAAGLVCQSGTGMRGDPFRYWLPAREADLFPEGEPLEGW